MSNPDAEAATVFNARDRNKSDTLVDASLTAVKQFDQRNSLALSVARKNRAPNLYERYSWGQGAMATSMIGWFGDGNGYIGNIDLQPETAHTAALNYQFDTGTFSVEARGWYTHVQDYIDVEVSGQFNRSSMPEGLRNILAFTNLDATLYGAGLQGRYQLPFTGAGQWQIINAFAWQRGERDDTGNSLYQIIPVKNTLTIMHTMDGLTTSLTWQWVGQKDNTDPRRLENETDAYSLLNASTQWQYDNLTLTLSVNNLTDNVYALPLGGVSIANYNVEPDKGFTQLQGAGRSFDFGIRYSF